VATLGPNVALPKAITLLPIPRHLWSMIRDIQIVPGAEKSMTQHGAGM
jgi:hypothetical protein